MVVLVKDECLKSKNFPETNLLKQCTKMNALPDGKTVYMLNNKEELLGTLNREDDAHCYLDLVGGKRIVGRYIPAHTGEKPTWTIYDTNETKTSKVIIIDENRTKLLKGLFNDMRKAAEQSLKSGKESVMYRNRVQSNMIYSR